MAISPIRLVLRLAALAALAAVATAAGAQPPATRTAVRVRVVDPAGAPVPEAEVSIVRGLSDVVATGLTDAAGTRLLTAALRDGEYHLVVRKIGRARVDRFFTPARDTIAFEVVSAPAPQTLTEVKVVERQSLKQRAYFIDAEAIANSKRPLIDASDIVTRLRPDMIFGVGGKRQNCAPVSFVWVNGIRIRTPPINPGLAMEKRMGYLAARSTPHLGVRGKAAIPYSVHATLASIKPEHVAEIRYHDCDDLSLQRANSESALFVTLKPGIGYEQGVGSYVAEAGVDDASVTDAPSRYRFRLLGVFDAESGAPLAGVEVRDVHTGARMNTSDTGTAHLAFLPDGGGTVRLSRPGYQPIELPVRISPTDTIPITLIMARAR